MNLEKEVEKIGLNLENENVYFIVGLSFGLARYHSSDSNCTEDLAFFDSINDVDKRLMVKKGYVKIMESLLYNQ